MIDKELLSKIKITPLLDTLYLESISDDEYFSEKYSGFISNSRMGYINPVQNGTPKKYFEEWGKTKLFTPSLAFGTAVHELALQPNSFFLCEDVVAPSAKVGLMADWLWHNVKDGNLPPDDQIREAAKIIDYYKGSPSSNQLTKVKEAIKPYFRSRFKFEQDSTDERQPIYLDDASRDRLRSTMKSLNNNKDIQKLLHPLDLVGDPLKSENEKTILLDIQVDVPDCDPVILRLKAKLDNFTVDPLSNIITVNDVKTSGKFLAKFNEAVKDYHYYREISFYSWLLYLCSFKFFNMKNPTIKGNFLVVETFKDFNSSVVDMKPGWFSAGTNEFKTLIKMIAYYTIHGYDKD